MTTTGGNDWYATDAHDPAPPTTPGAPPAADTAAARQADLVLYLDHIAGLRTTGHHAPAALLRAELGAYERGDVDGSAGPPPRLWAAMSHAADPRYDAERMQAAMVSGEPWQRQAAQQHSDPDTERAIGRTWIRVRDAVGEPVDLDLRGWATSGEPPAPRPGEELPSPAIRITAYAHTRDAGLSLADGRLADHWTCEPTGPAPDLEADALPGQRPGLTWPPPDRAESTPTLETPDEDLDHDL
jgi:hypothetical protein